MAKEENTQKTYNDFLFNVYKKHITVDVKNPKYPDIVDRTNFVRSSEKKRNMIASGNIGAGEKGLYDFQENEKVTKENSPTNIDIALREGKLDKADIQKLREIYEKAGIDTIELEKLKQEEAQEKTKRKNREKAMDDQLGINQE